MANKRGLPVDFEDDSSGEEQVPGTETPVMNESRPPLKKKKKEKSDIEKYLQEKSVALTKLSKEDPYYLLGIWLVECSTVIVFKIGRQCNKTRI